MLNLTFYFKKFKIFLKNSYFGKKLLKLQMEMEMNGNVENVVKVFQFNRKEIMKSLNERKKRFEIPIVRSSHPRLLKKGVLKNFAKFTGKHLPKNKND